MEQFKMNNLHRIFTILYSSWRPWGINMNYPVTTIRCYQQFIIHKLTIYKLPWHTPFQHLNQSHTTKWWQMSSTSIFPRASSSYAHVPTWRFNFSPKNLSTLYFRTSTSWLSKAKPYLGWDLLDQFRPPSRSRRYCARRWSNSLQLSEQIRRWMYHSWLLAVMVNLGKKNKALGWGRGLKYICWSFLYDFRAASLKLQGCRWRYSAGTICPEESNSQKPKNISIFHWWLHQYELGNEIKLLIRLCQLLCPGPNLNVVRRVDSAMRGWRWSRPVEPLHITTILSLQLYILTAKARGRKLKCHSISYSLSCKIFQQ